MTINLIPPKLKKEKETKKIVNSMFTGLSIIFLILLIVTAAIIVANYYIKSDLAALELKVSETNKTLKKYTDLEKTVDAVNAKIGTIDSIDQNRIIWSNIIADMAKSTPTEVQIRTMTTNSTTKNIALTGVAASRKDVAKLKEKLENSSHFQGVIFASSSYNDDSKDYNFSLTCTLEEIK